MWIKSDENYLKLLREKFPYKSNSWFNRCLKRINNVHRLNKNTWFIRGSSSLGDRRQYYIVTYDMAKNKYYCTCYDTFSPGGNRRRREVCSHVGAVILYQIILQKRLNI
mgnify:CR=1 FL=1